MDSDRSQNHSGTVIGDLFICFTSMKMSSRSSNRDHPISLTSSLSRRLRTNRSIKGGASPAMFSSTGKKRNFGENPEPSSPKVTCIGQVRVKSRKKKQGKRLRSLSRRHSSFCKNTNLGSSFGRNQETLREQSCNQRWVHFPFTICEALRAFGSEFSCLFPCRSSCFSSSREKEKDETEEGHRSSLCTRWLVVDGSGRRDIELMVRDENEDEENVRVSRSQHVFNNLEISQHDFESESRMSICIPPKNALLLMRCRSDPLKMEALANRLWDSTINPNNLDDDDNDDDDDDFDYDYHYDYDYEMVKKTADFEENQETELEQSAQEKEEILEIYEAIEEKDDEITFFGSLFDEIVDEFEEIDDEMMDASDLFEETETGEESNIEKVNHLPECLLLMMCEPKLSMEVSKETWVSSTDFFRRQPSRKKAPPPPLPPPVPVKLSDGQSKSKVTTFTNATTKYDKPRKSSATATATGPASASASVQVQPGRSSCSLPIRPSMAEILEQKLVNAVGYEPFVLNRCKSEPMRTAAAKLVPDTCYWKNRKLEPLRRATFGVGAAGTGC